MSEIKPVGYSYSMLSAYMACAYKYKCLYVDKLDFGQPASGDMSFGTAVHLGLNDCLSGGNGTDLFLAYWDTEKEKELRYGAFDWAKLRELGITFIERFIRLHASKLKPVSMEQRLRGTFANGVAAEGTPDFVGDYDGVPSVLDFKTSFREYDHSKLLSNPQLYLYAELARQVLGYEAKQVVYKVFIKKDQRIQTLVEPIDPVRMSRMLDMLGTYAKEAELLAEGARAGVVLTEADYPRNHNACINGSFLCDSYEHCWGKRA